MKPIETHYAGRWFRSRLEARWAVFFDAAGLPWEYEIRGFEVGADWYLPDFWLPTCAAYCEIKPAADDQADRERMDRIMSAWSGREALWLLRGHPAPEGYRWQSTGDLAVFGPDHSRRFLDCRRCPGLCYVLADETGCGDIGEHSARCAESDHWPVADDRIRRAFSVAGRWKFDHFRHDARPRRAGRQVADLTAAAPF